MKTRSVGECEDFVYSARVLSGGQWPGCSGGGGRGHYAGSGIKGLEFTTEPGSFVMVTLKVMGVSYLLADGPGG